MAYLIIRDTEGRDLLTEDLAPEAADQYYRAWMDADTITVRTGTYRLHSLARTRPERNLILCVSAVELPSTPVPYDE